MTEKKKRVQMAFNISQEEHTQVKILAAIRNISMNLWISRAITERIAKETKHEEKEWHGGKI